MHSIFNRGFVSAYIYLRLLAVGCRFTVGLAQNASTTLQHLASPWYIVQSLPIYDNQSVIALLYIELGWLLEAAAIIIGINYISLATGRAELSCASALTEIQDLKARFIQCVRANLVH
jgi:hypothetical protein